MELRVRSMFIAHIPSGYLMSVLFLERFRNVRDISPAVIAAGMIGSIAPDFDLIYCYLIDHQRMHHHKYFTHWPLSWLVLLAVSIIWVRLARHSRIGHLSLIFAASGVLHLLLDSLVGDIWWFAPLAGKPFALITVPAVFKPWWLNFFFHWSFAIELAICLWALTLFRRLSNKRQQIDRQQCWHTYGNR